MSSNENELIQSFARAYLLEQRRQARWRWIWRLLWIALAASLIWGVMQEVPDTSGPSTPHSALVDVNGEISAESEANADDINASLQSAFEDSGARAVMLRINSPGGSPVQAGIIHDEIVRLKAKFKKPVYAVCEEMCASAAFYIAVAADEIYVDKASIVGSIGVLMDGFGFTGVMDKLGVDRRLMTAGSNKGMLDPFSPRNLEQEAHAQAMLDQIHQQFIKVVRDGRGKRLKEDENTFSGMFWNGQQALGLGLADHLGTVDSIARDVIKEENIVDYTVKENLAERFAKRFGAAVGAGAVQAMRSAVTFR
jgi:protease IV